jgi:hypothetical protein
MENENEGYDYVGSEEENLTEFFDDSDIENIEMSIAEKFNN